MSASPLKLSGILRDDAPDFHKTGVICSSFITVGPSLLFLILAAVLKLITTYFSLGKNQSLFFFSSFTYLVLPIILIVSCQNSVLSRYLSDKIILGANEDISASLAGMLTLNCFLAAAVSAGLCGLLCRQDGIDLVFLVPYGLTGILIACICTLMAYLSAIREYGRLALSCLIGLAVTVGAIFLLYLKLDFPLVCSIYWSQVLGFLTACLLLMIRCIQAFGIPSHHYFECLQYYKKYWPLILCNVPWILGFFISNLIYWSCSKIGIKISIFRGAPSYDLAVYLALVINFSGMVFFEAKTESRVFSRYMAYLSALQQGSYDEIEKERLTLQQEIRFQLFFAYEVQLLLTVALITLCSIFSPQAGIQAQVLNLMMLLSVGLYTATCMYFSTVFLCCFDDHRAAMLGPCIFLIVTALGSFLCCHLELSFYPLPLLAGGSAGWLVSSTLLKRRLANLTQYLLCR